MKDDSFINLLYLLSVENNYNETLNSFNNNSINNPKTTNNNLNNDLNKVGNSNDNINKNEINNLKNFQEGIVTKKIIKRKNDSKIINGGINSSINAYNTKNEIISKTDFNLNISQRNIKKNLQNNKIMIKRPTDNNQKISNTFQIENNDSNKINNSIKNVNIKNNIPLNKTKKVTFDDQKIYNSYLSSATPKKKNIIQNNLFIHIDNVNLSNSFMNNSDYQNASTNRNDTLNLTVNSIDTNDFRDNNNSSEYKILSNNKNITQSNNIYSKKYLFTLNPSDYEYDTFCHAIIKTGLCEEKTSLSKYSENFPAPCGHELCSKLPALEPRVLNYYQNNEKINKIDIKQEATSHLVFPLGIKLCVEQNFQNENLSSEPLINTIYNEKGDLYYIASLTIFRKITIKNYNKIFNINPIDVYNKFKEEQNKGNKNADLNNNININLTNNKDDLLKYHPNDIIYIPECISLVSRFPFFNQLSICLKTIINMRRQIVNGDNNQKIENEISNFINHIINQIPIASNKYNILFYTPINIEPIILYNPFIYNFGNFTCQNIFSILSIDNIITIFLLILLEQKIIFVDINHLKLSSITFFFLNLIYPLSWVNTYQPLLSLSTIRYIQSITPFIMGGNENLILYAYYKKYIIYNELLDNIDKSNILFVSLTNNLISCDCYNLIVNKKGQSRKQILKYLNLPDLPKSLDKKLVNHLSEIEKIDDLKKMNEKIKNFFCRIMVFILDDYKDYFVNSLEKHIFNKDNYLMNKKDDRKPFYKELLGTQLFTQFIFNENENYKMKKIKMKKLKRKNLTYGILHEESYRDNTFFMKNKNKIDQLRIMIKQKRKEKIKNSIKSAKRIVKNLGQIFSGASDNKKSENEFSIKKCIKRNLSNFRRKKKRKNIDNIMLMPYFIEETNLVLTNTEKYDYIQNKLNSIMTIDNQLNQINNYKNKYIFDFNQKFDLKLIKDDKTRYFIGTLNQENELVIDNISKLNSHSNTSNPSKINGKNNTKNNLAKKGEIEQSNKNNKEDDFSKSKEKINLWYMNICLSSNKKKLSYDLNINEDLKLVKARKFFAKLISQNYRTLFDIRENNNNFLSNEGFMELLQKIKFILSKITYDEYDNGKLLTLVCFKYYTFLEEHKNTKYYIYNKYVELFSPCELWLNHIFWKTWFDEDISYIEKENNLSNEDDYSLELNKSDDKENELNDYNEEKNNSSIEYRLLIKIMKVMNCLKLEDKFINKVIYDDLAANYLTEDELNLFKEQNE